MKSIVVVGAQWGDEGKGKVVDYLAASFDYIARCAGGHNAGHTVIFNGSRFVLQLIPCGILRPGKHAVIGSGVVVDPAALVSELDTLSKAGIDITGRLHLSNRAHLIFPYHRQMEKAAEAARGAGKIGTTSRGIGPTYEDKMARHGIRVGDMLNPSRFREKLERVITEKNAVCRATYGVPLDTDGLADQYLAFAERLKPLIADASELINDALDANKSVMFEGAQGTMLDIDFGTYPFVTSSNAISGGACTGLGVGPTRINAVAGVTKAYTTRVGSGPFPTELKDSIGERLMQDGGEYGATTGRPRRCGWFDAVGVRHAVRINGLTGIALTKLDVLTGFKKIKICTAYKSGGETYHEFPASLRALKNAEPVWEEMEGWDEPLTSARKLSELPTNARRYVDRLEKIVGAEIILVSVGPGREETIVLRNPFN